MKYEMWIFEVGKKNEKSKNNNKNNKTQRKQTKLKDMRQAAGNNIVKKVGVCKQVCGGVWVIIILYAYETHMFVYRAYSYVRKNSSAHIKGENRFSYISINKF